ncbi:protein phosphatase [Prauserella shujinwangii]|uniref:Serine/threonine protein phosphatase PstP n=1 Tax=Prauserella shujinwangii TaxID=1453103 RepID=A0A2T0LWS4_9PSEU|nr:PP2C family serine/threonine-protein phosphatase [Prauserella shujinwangii]PRX48473.1 protein phosphatase [Prauserella shujinwangii]
MTHDDVLGLRYAAGSDTGRRRSGNEDSVFTSPRLLAVADGMGGHAHGEVASELAMAAIADLDRRVADLDPAELEPETALRQAVADAAGRLDEQVAGDADLAGMGTTLTALLWDGTRFTLAHIGDSRGYLLRDGELSRLTKDHTVVQSLVDEGSLAPELAAGHPHRSVLTRALLAESPAEPDVAALDVRPGDRYLLCSDGLTDAVDDEDIQDVLATVTEPAQAVRTLIDLANDNGGPDNITCVVADVTGGHDRGQ